MEQRNPERERPEWPAWAALLVAFAVAAGVATASWLAWVFLAFGGASVFFFFVLPSLLPFFLGTFVFGILAPSRRWNVGLWLSGCLVIAVCGLGLLGASAANPPRAGVFGVVVAVAAAACYSGLAVAPPRDRGAVRRALLAILAGVVVVALFLLWDSPRARQHRQKRVDLGCYPISPVVTCIARGGNCCTWLKWRKEA